MPFSVSHSFWIQANRPGPMKTSSSTRGHAHAQRIIILWRFCVTDGYGKTKAFGVDRGTCAKRTVTQCRNMRVYDSAFWSYYKNPKVVVFFSHVRNGNNNICFFHVSRVKPVPEKSRDSYEREQKGSVTCARLCVCVCARVFICIYRSRIFAYAIR